MSYLSAPETDQLQLPSNGGFWVKMKRSASYGDELAAQGALVRVTRFESNGHSRPDEAPQMVSRAEVGAYHSTLISRLIVEWNLTDDSEKVMVISPKSVESLTPEDGDFLQTEAQRRLGRLTEEEKAPLPKRSGRRSTAIQ